MTAKVIAATERVEDLLVLWREVRRLDHRVRLARIRFELVGLEPEEQDELTDELAEGARLVRAFAALGRAG